MSETKEEKKEKCFIIMPISDQGDYPVGHFTKVYEQIIKPSVEDAGYEAYRVDENNICDAIINKIFSAIQECPMAICDLSNRNPNVLYELGLRQAYDKPVVLIQDDKTEKIFDISGISTVFYKSTRIYEDVIEARENIKKAILATREGKVNTLAKIVKVSAADFSQIEVSQDDKISVMLEGIYSEIRELKNKEEKERFYPVISEQRKSIDSHGNWLTMSFIAENIDKFQQLKMELSNINDIIFMDKIKVTPDKWTICFKLLGNIDIGEMIKAISEIAAKFSFHFTGDYKFGRI